MMEFRRGTSSPMRPPFDAKKLQDALEGMDFSRQLAFGVGIAERMLPNYNAFTAEDGRSEERPRIALDEAWRVVESPSVAADHFVVLADECEQLAPDTEDSSSLLVSAALDAISAILYLARFVSDRQVEHLGEIASLAIDTIDLYVQETEAMAPSDPNREDKILYHPLMQRELERQHEDVVWLGSMAGSSQSDRPCIAMRERWRAPSVGCLDL